MWRPWETLREGLFSDKGDISGTEPTINSRPMLAPRLHIRRHQNSDVTMSLFSRRL
jgi:hypothetical protein